MRPLVLLSSLCLLLITVQLILTFYSNKRHLFKEYVSQIKFGAAVVLDDDHNATPTSRHPPHSKIAIISSFIPSKQYIGSPARVGRLDDLINKACYAHRWGYDYIFNMTHGFDRKSTAKAHWLQYGTWHRVPHIQAKLHKDSGYDWVLYTDTDYLIKDMSRPLESFLNEFEFYNKKNVHVFLPREDLARHTFSSFVVMIRNSDFGRAVVKNWMDFAHGICPNGNVPSNPDKYDWMDSDQPGIWYALVKTHMQFYPRNNSEFDASFPLCNKTTGLLATPRAMGPELNQYMGERGLHFGNFGSDLSKMPDDQPIIWSTNKREESRPGLGIQWTYGNFHEDVWPYAFAIHKKSDWPAEMIAELDHCKRVHGCYANYTKNDKLEIGCNGVKFTVE